MSNATIFGCRLKILWVYTFILGFAYEKPIFYVTSLDRLNPRLFDILIVIGVILFWKDIFKPNKFPKSIGYWKWLVIWFGFCALTWFTFFLPVEKGYFSLFFAIKYLMGLLGLFFVLNTDFDAKNKRVISDLVILNGVFVAAYCIPELLDPVREVEISPGKVVKKFGLVLFGPFGVTYFHIAQFSALSFAFAWNKLFRANKVTKQVMLFVISVFISWPLFFCGSRTAIVFFVLVVTISLFFQQKKIYKLILPFLLVVASLLYFNIDVNRYFNDDTSATLQRMNSISKSNSVENRISLWYIEFDKYIHDGISMAFIGSGFYVVPKDNVDRVGFGIHNIYLFPFEQGGVLAMGLFLAFIIGLISALYKIVRNGVGYDSNFALPVLVFILTTILLGIVGQIFWRGFGTNNINSYIVVLALIALLPSKLKESDV